MWVVFCNVYCFSNKMVCVEVFFHFLDNFCGKKPPCCEVLFVRVGIGAALQVFSMDIKFFSTMSSNIIHVSCHSSGVRWL